MTTVSRTPTIVLVGLESVGKSALFRTLTGQAIGDEANFRGSTVRVRSASLADGTSRLLDTPGIRVHDDSLTTRLALEQATGADVLLLVVRSTHVQQELHTLFSALGHELTQHKTALVLTFGDKATPTLAKLPRELAAQWGIPVVMVNARTMNAQQQRQLEAAIAQAAPVHAFAPHAEPIKRHEPQPILLLPTATWAEIAPIEPQITVLEDRRWGPWLAIALMILLFAVPVYLAYCFADWLQPLVDAGVIAPLIGALAPLADRASLLFAILAGDYGLITLGWYSFLWAFPVVLILGISLAVTEESGLKDRMTAALDPWLRRIGLNGRDLVPVLTGFGCNVVAVFQSRSCSRCTRTACISLITFGAACSYQIGASLSLFNAAGSPWLFAPYLTLLFVVGALHTRLWQRGLADAGSMPLAERAFLQKPTWRGVAWRVRTVLQQFLREAMPIFLLICTVGATLDYFGVTTWLSAQLAPWLGLIGLPGEVAPGVIFSMIRKDGLLVLNQGRGELLQGLTLAQLFILVYLSSTLTACLVTLWTIRQELGWQAAAQLASRQVITSVVSTLGMAAFLAIWL